MEQPVHDQQAWQYRAAADGAQHNPAAVLLIPMIQTPASQTHPRGLLRRGSGSPLLMALCWTARCMAAPSI